jgi:DNA-binding response OmpR family regulator
MKDARILVVDDEAEVLELLRTWLEEQGCEVLTTESAIEAESLITSASIDLALLDVGMHGLRLGRKAMSVGKPFILMSGMPVVIEMGELGAVLRKPFSLSEVNRIIERSLERSRREAEFGVGLGAAGAA